MASAAPPLATTLVIGPQAGGRGYRVLARSEGQALPGAAEGRLSEIALAIAGWAEQREAPAVALVPLADAAAPALLMRLAWLGNASLGTIAYAQGMILDEAGFAACAGRPEDLLPLIPLPDGSRRFAEQPLPLRAARPPAPRHDWSGLGLEWRDRLVLVGREDDEEPALRSILASVPPAGPGARVRGWATTALLPSSGSFSPVRELQLLVTHEGRGRPADLHHLAARISAAGFEGERVALTPAAQAWQRLKALGAADRELAGAVGPLRWSPEQMNAAPRDVLGPASVEAMRRLGGGAQMRFLLELARPRGDGLDADLAASARALLDYLFARPSLEPQHAAFYIKAIADGPPEAAQALAPAPDMLVRAGTGRWLRGPTFGRLLAMGYAAGLAERAEEAPALIDGLGAEELAALLDQVMLARDETLRPVALITALLRALAEEGSENPVLLGGSAYAAALSWRLAQPGEADETRLGARSVVRATAALAPQLMAPLARRTLRLRRPGATPRERLDAAGGALEWMKRQGVAA